MTPASAPAGAGVSAGGGAGGGVERPILFSTPMVHTLLDGSKTQTRRVVKPQPGNMFASFGALPTCTCHPYGFHDGETHYPCPYGQPGDRLWVRETWNYSDASTLSDPRVIYRAGDERSVSDPNWRPSIFMPRWASRILLEITEVRVERLQAISEQDAQAEGMRRTWTLEPHMPTFVDEGHPHPGFTYRNGFQAIWQQINGAASWEANPWVWAVSFRRPTPTP